ncbi:aromatic amino acid DMT transporter YddG [Vibrio hannami]|uniref:aromatic amino acid DMT transporter YddG n=1 Tax=Vibrio hannami TaxID=2717094 RepID=UPI00240F077E|nr:aromatic amino acid DMT transporter YddG [Vibrio hannami]MDG3088432.1 aromatic amino acid DMT transporter YddG [Vibrio hannami]
MLASYKYNLYGITAILLWACLVGMFRNVTEQLGPIGGAALVYTCSSLFLMLSLGIPKLRQFSKSYIVVCGALFAAYEVCFSLALGFASDRLQTVEIAIVNYLWPSLTVLLAVFAGSKKVSLWVYPAILLAFFGVTWSIIGDEGLSLSRLIANVSSNPLAYLLAFAGAIIWAVYCNLTRRMSNGQNGITLFFIFTALSLWIQFFVTDTKLPDLNWSVAFDVALTSIFMGSGYALWNVAIIGGNMLFLATLSYFTPILSTFFSIIILGITVSGTFWQGVIMVTVGSLICWRVTK